MLLLLNLNYMRTLKYLLRIHITKKIKINYSLADKEKSLVSVLRPPKQFKKSRYQVGEVFKKYNIYIVCECEKYFQNSLKLLRLIKSISFHLYRKFFNLVNTIKYIKYKAYGYKCE